MARHMEVKSLTLSQVATIAQVGENVRIYVNDVKEPSRTIYVEIPGSRLQSEILEKLRTNAELAVTFRARTEKEEKLRKLYAVANDKSLPESLREVVLLQILEIENPSANAVESESVETV